MARDGGAWVRPGGRVRRPGRASGIACGADSASRRTPIDRTIVPDNATPIALIGGQIKVC
jgi:hypothetical protein